MILSLKRPGITLGFIILMYGIEQFLQTRDPTFVVQSNIVNIGIGLLGLVGATAFMIKNLSRFAVVDVQVAVIALYALAWASQLWTSMPRMAWEHFSAALPYEILFFLLAPVLMLGRNEVRTGLRTVFFIGFPLIVLFALFVEWSGRGVRLATPVMNNGVLVWETPSLALANLGARVAILSVILIPKNFLARSVYVISFCLASYVVYRTQSRGQLLALILVILICFPIANRAASLKGMATTLFGFTILSGVLILVFSYFDLGEVNRWGEGHVSSAVDGRWAMMQGLLTKWSTGSPTEILFGLGAASSFKMYGTYVHNLPAEILGELGLVGFGIYAYIYFQVSVKSKRILQRLGQFPEMRREIVALLAMFLFATLISFKEESLSSSNFVFFFAIMIAHVERNSKKMASASTSLRGYILMPPNTQQGSPSHYPRPAGHI